MTFFLCPIQHDKRDCQKVRLPLVYRKTKEKVQEYCTHRNGSFPAVWFVGIAVGILEGRNGIPSLSQESYRVGWLALDQLLGDIY